MIIAVFLKVVVAVTLCMLAVALVLVSFEMRNLEPSTYRFPVFSWQRHVHLDLWCHVAVVVAIAVVSAVVFFVDVGVQELFVQAHKVHTYHSDSADGVSVTLDRKHNVAFRNSHPYKLIDVPKVLSQDDNFAFLCTSLLEPYK